MAESQATVGPGALLDYLRPADGVWVHVAELLDINGPSETTEEVDVTNQDSTGAFREFRATLQDGGTLTAEMNAVPGDAGQVALAALKHDRTIVSWRILIGETGYYKHFRGFINNLSNTFPVNGAFRKSFGIRVSGPVTETTGAS